MNGNTRLNKVVTLTLQTRAMVSFQLRFKWDLVHFWDRMSKVAMLYSAP